jgi:Na+/alanine symporter
MTEILQKLRERRWNPMAAKFATQRKVTWMIFALMAVVIVTIIATGDVDDIKEIYNTMLPFFAMAIGYWLGSSQKGDQKDDAPKPAQPEETKP